MFSDRFDKLMTKLDAKNTDIAQTAGIDRTNLSRFRSGRRIPKQESNIIEALVSALYDHASSTGKLKMLCRMIKTDSKNHKQIICRAMKLWLYSDTPEEYFIRKSRPKRSSLSFSDRFDKSMILADMTNSRLGKLVHVDSSLISHYRTGIRTPQSNPALASVIADILYERIRNAGEDISLAELMQIKPDSITKEAFRDWLYAFTQDEDGGNTAMKLLEAFDSYIYASSVKLPVPETSVPSEILTDKRKHYTGNTGLREAVLRFLAEVAKSDASEMMLYSDQDMGWMITDKEFAVKWAALMGACIKKGIRLSIIHNIDRDLDEMSQAITNWMPLYMSGMIRSYYHTKKVGDRFTHTLFLCPGTACILGCTPNDPAHEGRYYFFTERSDLTYCQDEYETLMKHTRPLVRMEPYTLKTVPKKGIRILDDSGHEAVASSSPYKNMSVIISSDSVRIIRTRKPFFSFTVTHPLMRKAFLAYAERLR
ncbi:MAG: hypothetical protein K6B72_00480 [Lachnospiraceae bacterium]|nr:hypothetical protein [Lachnospiraceae bacterium]